MSDLRRIRAAYATAHALSVESVDFVPFRVVADWWESREAMAAQREAEIATAYESGVAEGMRRAAETAEIRYFG